MRRMVADADGEPVIMSKEEMVGLDPEDINVVQGRIHQLQNDGGPMLLTVLQFYTERLDQSKPSAVTEGQAAATAAAWQVRQLLEASSELLEQIVENHAEAVKQVQLLWVRWMRMLDEPIFAFAAPGARSGGNLRGLIEMKPEDLVETIRVSQAPQSAQQRVVLRQEGIELLQAGRIDEFKFYSEYDLAADPEEEIVRAWAQRAVDLVMLARTEDIPEGSVMADIVEAVRGSLTMEMLQRVPAFALASAQEMASTAATAAAGNVAQPHGVVQPGLGMPLAQSGDPLTQAPPGVI